MNFVKYRLAKLIYRRNGISSLNNDLNFFLKTHFCTSALPEVTAGVAVIGDEILKGLTEEVNIHFLIKNLNQIGIKVKKICILPDDTHVIAEEILKLSKTCTVVLTSGGIGPTHDDVTFEAVANAFGDVIIKHDFLSQIFTRYLGEKSLNNPAVIKLSSVPRSSVLNFGPKSNDGVSQFPVISVKNVYILPGVPMLLRKGFEVFKANFVSKNMPNIVKTLYLSLDEINITNSLNETVEAFKERVTFGSYPAYGENYFKVKLILESLNENWISEAELFLKNRLPLDCVVNLKKNILSTAQEDLDILCNNSPQFQSAQCVVKKAFDTYDPQQMCICFNGGKDCTALLHLIYTCSQSVSSEDWAKIHILYVRTSDTFNEIEEFIQATAKFYNVNLIILEGELKKMLCTYLHKNPHIQMIFMGTRRSDPDSTSLSHFSFTDSGWPPVMRVLPILNWSYMDVWTFIRGLQLRYCTLYDRGYTSIGTKSQTSKNSALLTSKDKGFNSHKPAYLLSDESLERTGRLK